MFVVYCATETFGQKCIEQKLTIKKIISKLTFSFFLFLIVFLIHQCFMRTNKSLSH
jgi:hypothetical protein